MKKSVITPGPWALNKEGVRVAEGYRLVDVLAPDHSDGALHGDTIPVAINLEPADGNLIAASPELLETLKRSLLAVNVLRDMCRRVNLVAAVETAEAMAGEIRGIVAKAEGGQS